MSTTSVGKPMDRVDGRLKVTGRAKYAAEFALPNLAYGFVVTSTVAALHRALDEPAVRRRLTDSGLEIATQTPGAFEALIARDADAWEARVRKGLVRAG